MVTPFTLDGEINYELAEKLAVHLTENGSDALVVCGTTGESPTLSWHEEQELFQVIVRAVAGRAQVIAGTGSNSTYEAIAATQKAATLGVDATLQVVPYYNKPPQSGLYQHFKAIADAAPDLPLMLYNIPGRTGQNLLPETIARLADVPNIVAVKEASGNFDQISLLRSLVSDDFLIYSGDDALTLPMLALGAYGVVSVASHLVGSQLQQLTQAFIQGNTNLALNLHLKLLPLFKALFLTTNPIPVKAALQLQGWQVGSPRLPLSDAPSEVIDALKSVMMSLSLL